MLVFGNDIIARRLDSSIEKGEVMLERKKTDPKYETINETFDIPLSVIRA